MLLHILYTCILYKYWVYICIYIYMYLIYLLRSRISGLWHMSYCKRYFLSRKLYYGQSRFSYRSKNLLNPGVKSCKESINLAAVVLLQWKTYWESKEMDTDSPLHLIIIIQPFQTCISSTTVLQWDRARWFIS